LLVEGRAPTRATRRGSRPGSPDRWNRLLVDCRGFAIDGKTKAFWQYATSAPNSASVGPHILRHRVAVGADGCVGRCSARSLKASGLRERYYGISATASHLVAGHRLPIERSRKKKWTDHLRMVRESRQRFRRARHRHMKKKWLGHARSDAEIALMGC